MSIIESNSEVILAIAIGIKIDPPRITPPQPAFKEELLLVHLEVGVDHHDAPLHVDDGFDELAIHRLGHAGKFAD